MHHFVAIRIDRYQDPTLCAIIPATKSSTWEGACVPCDHFEGTDLP